MHSLLAKMIPHTYCMNHKKNCLLDSHSKLKFTEMLKAKVHPPTEKQLEQFS